MIIESRNFSASPWLYRFHVLYHQIASKVFHKLGQKPNISFSSWEKYRHHVLPIFCKRLYSFTMWRAKISQ